MSEQQPSAEDYAAIDRLVDTKGKSYADARYMVTGEAPMALPTPPSERQIARQASHERNTELYHLTGPISDEQAADTALVRQGEAAQDVHDTARELGIASLSQGDEKLANALRMAQAARQSPRLANNQRTQN